MADYSSFHALALRLIAKKGAAMTFIHVNEHEDIDPVTGKRAVELLETPFMGVITRPTTQEMRAGLFQGAGMVILAPGQSVSNPDTTDIIRFDDREYAIKEIIRVAPAGDVILYKFGVAATGGTR